MNNINIIVVEDDLTILEFIQNELEFQDYNVVGTFDNGEDAIKFMQKFKPHIVILDIKLKGKMTGIDIARYIDSSIKVPYIFLSDHTTGNIYKNVLKTNAANYLSKPFNPEQLNLSITLTLDKVYTQKNPFARFDNCFLIKNGDSFYNICVSDMIYIEYDSIDKRTKIYSRTNNKVFIIPTGLEDFLRQFPHPDLLRINRNQIINLKMLCEINKSTYKAILRCPKEYLFNVGSNYFDKLLLAFITVKDQDRK